MARYTGSDDFEETILAGIRSGEVVIETDEGTLCFRAQRPTGRIVFGKTNDKRTVSIDLDDPGHITVT
ncbi:MAG: hypothetical protein ABIR46_04465 [Candidatus Saccharimonadales bacterium]